MTEELVFKKPVLADGREWVDTNQYMKQLDFRLNAIHKDKGLFI